jgi:hypothetical protein
VFSPEQFLKLVGDTYKRITYDDQLHTYIMSHISYADFMSQHNFLTRYDKDMQLFYKDLRRVCHDILVESLEKFEVTPVGLIWKLKIKDLFELVVALTEIKAVQTLDEKTDRKAVTAEFDKIFGGVLKNAESLLSHTSSNSGSNPGYFLKQLDQAFQTHLSRKLK